MKQNDEQQAVLKEIASLFRMKQAADTARQEVQRDFAQRCIEAHNLGLSDRQIAEALDGEISRTRIQQLRTR